MIKDFENITYAADEAEGTKKAGFFKRLADGLSKTRNAIMGGLNDIFDSYDIDE